MAAATSVLAAPYRLPSRHGTTAPNGSSAREGSVFYPPYHHNHQQHSIVGGGGGHSFSQNQRKNLSQSHYQHGVAGDDRHRFTHAKTEYTPRNGDGKQMLHQHTDTFHHHHAAKQSSKSSDLSQLYVEKQGVNSHYRQYYDLGRSHHVHDLQQYNKKHHSNNSSSINKSNAPTSGNHRQGYVSNEVDKQSLPRSNDSSLFKKKQRVAVARGSDLQPIEEAPVGLRTREAAGGSSAKLKRSQSLTYRPDNNAASLLLPRLHDKHQTSSTSNILGSKHDNALRTSKKSEKYQVTDKVNKGYYQDSDNKERRRSASRNVVQKPKSAINGLNVAEKYVSADPDTGTGKKPSWVKRSQSSISASARKYEDNDQTAEHDILHIEYKDAEDDDTDAGSGEFDSLSRAFELEVLLPPMSVRSSYSGAQEQQEEEAKVGGGEEPCGMWHSLPMQSELDSYIHRMSKTYARNANFTSSLNIPVFNKEQGGPINRPHTQRAALYDKQKARFGKQALSQNMQENKSMTDSVFGQRDRTYEMQTRMKTILQDGILKHY